MGERVKGVFWGCFGDVLGSVWEVFWVCFGGVFWEGEGGWGFVFLVDFSYTPEPYVACCSISVQTLIFHLF